MSRSKHAIPLVIILELVLLLGTIETGLGQSGPELHVSKKFDSELLTDALDWLESRYDVKFAYIESSVHGVRVSTGGEELVFTDYLEDLLSDTQLSFYFHSSNRVTIYVDQKEENQVGQYTIEGIVIEESTGKPVPGVNVYFSGTTIGSSTDRNGVYQIRTSLRGIYNLVFTFVGFHRVVKTVTLSQENQNLTVDATLKPKVHVMNELKVVSQNKEWKLRYAQFFKEFIGKTEFAKETEILNPWVVEFKKNKDNGNLTANTAQPLEVKNHALGYNITIELDDYSWSGTTGKGYYRVYPRFEEMTTGDKGMMKKWRKNREKAYRSSKRHFFYSLYHDKINSNLYTVRPSFYLVRLNDAYARYYLLTKKGYSKDLIQVLRGFRLLSETKVVYGRINDYQSSLYGGTQSNTRETVVFPNSKEGVFFIDPFGNLVDPLSLKFQGYWSNHRMAHELPLNYKSN